MSGKPVTCPMKLLHLHKGNPASTAFRKNPFYTPNKAVVCTGFAVCSVIERFFHYDQGGPIGGKPSMVGADPVVIRKASGYSDLQMTLHPLLWGRDTSQRTSIRRMPDGKALPGFR
jgi:hypothetical protein